MRDVFGGFFSLVNQNDALVIKKQPKIHFFHNLLGNGV
jgi:hypothetical protein